MPKLGWTALGVGLFAVELHLHAKIVAHSNTLYGHSDADVVEPRTLRLREVSKHDGAGMDLFMPRCEERTRFDRDEILRIRELCGKLHHHFFMACRIPGKRFRDRLMPPPIRSSDPD